MIIQEIAFTLKDGRKALLRSPRDEDVRGMLDYLYQSAGETEFIMAYPDERAGMTVEEEENLLRGVIESPGRIMMVCEVNGELAGNCGLHVNNKRKVRHRGGVAIALYKKYWNRGIGTAMFNYLFDIARDWGLEQLELDYVEGNERGRALYEKMGFEAYGALPNAFHLSDGSSRAEIKMLKRL